MFYTAVATSLAVTVFGINHGQASPLRGELLVDADATELATSVYTDAVLVKEAERYQLIGVAHQFQRSSTGSQFKLVLGIYPDVSSAERATRLAEVDGRSLHDVGDWNLFAASSFRIRIKNAVVLIELPRDLEDTKKDEIARALAAGLQDARVTRPGSSVDAPKINVLSARRLDGDGYAAVFSVVPENAVVDQGEKQPDGTWRVAGSKSIRESEFTLRVAAPNGAVGELPVSRFPEQAWEADLSPPADTLPAEERQRIASALRNGEGTDIDIVRSVLKLSEHPTADDSDLFEMIIVSDRPGPAKIYALRGLNQLRGAAGISQYRAYASDRAQHPLVRRDAVDLIKRYGGVEDIPRLEAIQQEGQEDLAVAAEIAIRMLKGVPPGD